MDADRFAETGVSGERTGAELFSHDKKPPHSEFRRNLLSQTMHRRWIGDSRTRQKTAAGINQRVPSQ